MTARQTEPAPGRQLAFALHPARAFHHFLNALGKAVALHAQIVHGDTWRLEQIAATDDRRIDSQMGSNLIQLRLKGKTDIHRPMAAHGATRRLIGQHTIAVVTDAGNIVERAQQRTGIKNGNNPIRAVRAAILHYASGHSSDAAIFLHAGFQINDGARASTMRPENFFSRISDFDWRFGFARSYRRDDLQRYDLTLAPKAAAHQRLDHANL